MFNISQKIYKNYIKNMIFILPNKIAQKNYLYFESMSLKFNILLDNTYFQYFKGTLKLNLILILSLQLMNIVFNRLQSVENSINIKKIIHKKVYYNTIILYYISSQILDIIKTYIDELRITIKNRNINIIKLNSNSSKKILTRITNIYFSNIIDLGKEISICYYINILNNTQTIDEISKKNYFGDLRTSKIYIISCIFLLLLIVLLL